MNRSLLAFWCGNLFLFFYNLACRLDDEFATGLIEAMVDALRAARQVEAVQSNYRRVVK